jgi:peptide/nickel transport system substrate-binding protein
MHNFLTFIKEFRLPTMENLRSAIASFSKTQFWVFITSLAIAFCAMIIMLERINTMFLVDVPSDGGAITEGIIGMPSLVNPVLAVSDADKDLTSIVYSGLMRKSEDNMFVPDLAESYTVSPDGLTYTFHLRTGTTFHDDTPVTADDVIFTVSKIQDPLIKSPRRSGWEGVTASAQDKDTVVFTLNRPYISFINNTTIGILPQHLWKKVSAPEFALSSMNIKGIGSGPYKVDSVNKNSDGIPEQYKLSRFTNFILGEPHVKHITIRSYANESELVKALTSHSIDQAGGISPENAELLTNSSYSIHTSTLPRIFGVFWNRDKNKVLADSAVTKAIEIALDRKSIVDTVLDGYGTVINSPVPSTIINTSNSRIDQDGDLARAQSILDKAGWLVGSDGIRAKGSTTTATVTKKVGKKTITQTVIVPSKSPAVRLSFTLTTGDTPELKHTSQMIRDQLAKLGVEVDISKVYETGTLNQKIRSRDYEALFFGQVVNNESDLYAFWHSSQKSDPGLNIALYSNKTADDILTSIQKTLVYANRVSKYQDFIAEFNKDMPAILIYSPQYLYATSNNLDHITISAMSNPADRFLSIHNWYASKDRVWKIFAKDNK